MAYVLLIGFVDEFISTSFLVAIYKTPVIDAKATLILIFDLECLIPLLTSCILDLEHLYLLQFLNRL